MRNTGQSHSQVEVYSVRDPDFQDELDSTVAYRDFLSLGLVN